ncbi:hypothetical protein [Aquirhabdus sp.]|uniref:hypothetical protein n=1 Tax=Aquirhabdus sp. TaxID=2824160 RepID=UPI00396CE0A6
MDIVLKQKFQSGDKVLVSARAGWSSDSVGTINGLPELVETLQGEDFYYWVKFDEPQHDLSVDGPYDTAQILSRSLSLLTLS